MLWILSGLCPITIVMAGVDMTVGNPTRLLLNYSIPLVLGNLFQLFYNAADSMIAGRFIGKEALAAIGMSSPVTNIIILSISGICIGSGVLMSRFFGSRRYADMKREMSTVLGLGLSASFIITCVGMLATPVLLRVLNAPVELHDDAGAYLRIIFLGVPFTFVFNALSSGLKSVGDSKTSLRFLVFSSILNLALDLVFIGYFRLGIRCSAVTTVVAEAVSAILCATYIYRKVPELVPEEGLFRIDPGLLSMTLSYGSATALQQSIQPVCKLLIQGAVNALGVDAIAAFNAVSRIDDFAFTPEQSIAVGIMTYIAQNDGAGKKERISKGIRKGLSIEIAYGIMIGAAAFLFRKDLSSLFVPRTESNTIMMAARYLSIMSFFYILPALTNGIQGMFRGIGRMKVTVAATAIQASLRVVFTYILISRAGIAAIPYACAIGWLCMLLYEVPLAISSFGGKKRPSKALADL